MPKKWICIGLIGAVVVLSGCGIEEGIKSDRGRGDAPHPGRNTINGDPADFIIEMPDGWGNVATKCAYTGYRAFESTKSGGASSLVIVKDDRCKPQGTGPS